MKVKNLLQSFIVLLLVTGMVACNSKGKSKEKTFVNPEFSTYISAFSSGDISRGESIKVVLTQSIDTSKYKIGEALPEGLFELSPSIDGVAKFTDPFTIQFTPEKWFEVGAQYEVDFNLKEIQEVPEGFGIFEFDFFTPMLDYMVGLKGFDKNSTYEKLNLEGSVIFTDVVDTSEVFDMLMISPAQTSKNIVWQQNGDRRFDFVIEGIERKKEAFEVELSFEGKGVGIKKQLTEKYMIPALGDFKVTDVQVDNGIEQSVTVYFSDPLKKNFNFKSFITLNGSKNNKIVFLGNALKIYPAIRVNGEKSLSIASGIKNSKGYGMAEAQEFLLSFYAIKPQIELLGKGTVLPSANAGLLFPFKAVNVNSVIVSITKIYTNNIGQFLQVNEFSGTYQLTFRKCNLLSQNPFPPSL